MMRCIPSYNMNLNGCVLCIYKGRSGNDNGSIKCGAEKLADYEHQSLSIVFLNIVTLIFKIICIELLLK